MTNGQGIPLGPGRPLGDPQGAPLLPNDVVGGWRSASLSEGTTLSRSELISPPPAWFGLLVRPPSDHRSGREWRTPRSEGTKLRDAVGRERFERSASTVSWRNRLSILEAEDYLLVNLQVNDLTRMVEVQRRRPSHTSTMGLRPKRSDAAPRDLHTACGQPAAGHRASDAGEGTWHCSR